MLSLSAKKIEGRCSDGVFVIFAIFLFLISHIERACVGQRVLDVLSNLSNTGMNVSRFLFLLKWCLV